MEFKIKTDKLDRRYKCMRECDPQGSRFSADWGKRQSTDTRTKSLCDCRKLFDYVAKHDGFKDDYVILAGNALEWLDTDAVATDDPALAGFLCYQLERYAIRIMAAHNGKLRLAIMDTVKPRFGLGKAPKEPEQPATKLQPPKPAKQVKPAKPAAQRKPAKQDKGDKLDLILNAVQGIATRMDSLENRVTALEAR